MRNPFKKKFTSIHTWQYEPYAFEIGLKYIIEINVNNITMREVGDLDRWIQENNLNIKLVLSKGASEKRALQPIEVKHLTEKIHD